MDYNVFSGRVSKDPVVSHPYPENVIPAKIDNDHGMVAVEGETVTRMFETGDSPKFVCPGKKFQRKGVV